MERQSREMHSLGQLRQFVNQELCTKDKLEVGAFPVTERVLMRNQRPCGLYFCLHGPRSMKITAIWETDSNTILFYGADGQRFSKTRLAAAPPLSRAA